MTYAKIEVHPSGWNTGKDPDYVGACVTAALKAISPIARVVVDRHGLVVEVPIGGVSDRHQPSDCARLEEELRAAMPNEGIKAKPADPEAVFDKIVELHQCGAKP